MRLLIVIVATTCFSLPAQAIELLGEKGIRLDLGATLIAQESSRQRAAIDKDTTASIDIIGDIDLPAGGLHLYVEGATTAITSANQLVDGANADAGTAANRNGRGRVQLSELYYSLPRGGMAMHLGLIDLTVFADTTVATNDETHQFLGASLVNDPAIAFPDYTPALVAASASGQGVRWTAALASARGLSDDPKASYRELFDFGKTSDGLKNGVFALGELKWEGIKAGLDATLGGWHSSAELPRHDGLGTDAGAFGLYANLDGILPTDALWSLRLGWNNAASTLETVRFASLAIEQPFGPHALGIGTAYHGQSGEFKRSLAPDRSANPWLIEAYVRWQLTDWLTVSPDVQYWRHPNSLAAASGRVAGHVWTYGLRAQLYQSHRTLERLEQSK